MRYLVIFLIAGLISLPVFFIHWIPGWAAFLGLYYLGLKAIAPKPRGP